MGVFYIDGDFDFTILSEFRERLIKNNKLSWTAQRFAVGVRSPRGRRWDTSRIPDVTVLPVEQWQNLAN